MTGSAASPPAPGVFLSHAREDKGFVRRLARDLLDAGVTVWVDDAEMGVGDSLLEKIANAIADMTYVAVVISPHSAQSEWVTKEIEIALTHDVAGHKVKLLPLLLRGGAVPPSLEGKIFADFTSELNYENSLRKLLVRLGVVDNAEVPSDRLTELASSSALLDSALKELRGRGLTNATADALVASNVADVELSEFLSLVAREVHGEQLWQLAISIPQYIDEREVGHDALDYCLTSGEFSEWQMFSVGIHMRDVTTDSAVRWCHSRLVRMIKNDPTYQSFLARHVEVVLRSCFDEMAAYLLQPDRGPDKYNIDSFELIIRSDQRSLPFQTRVIEWIRDGRFDSGEHDLSENARILYTILNENWGEPAFGAITNEIQGRVQLLLRSISAANVRQGMSHVISMIAALYRGAEILLDQTRDGVYDLEPDDARFFSALTAGLQVVAAAHRDPADESLQTLARQQYFEILKIMPRRAAHVEPK